MEGSRPTQAGPRGDQGAHSLGSRARRAAAAILYPHRQAGGDDGRTLCPCQIVVLSATGYRRLSRRRYCNPIQFHSESVYQRDPSSPATRLKCLCQYPVSRFGADMPSRKQPESSSPTESKYKRRPVLCLQTSDCSCWLRCLLPVHLLATVPGSERWRRNCYQLRTHRWSNSRRCS